MLSLLRTHRLTGLPLALAAGVVMLLALAVSPAYGSASNGSCADVPVSSINQYCENIPSAAGGKAGPGSPAVGPAPRIDREIAASKPDSRRRRLLTLPAGSRRVPIRGATASTNSFPLLLLLVALAIALILAAIAAARWRRRASPA
jgi:hypothetical protein